MNIILCSLLLLGAYLIGSIPVGFMIAANNGVADITKHGSGNIGATNVARVLGKKYFALVFFLDFFKAFVYVLLINYFFQNMFLNYAISLVLLLGNGYSLFLAGRGGKGVATTVGVLTAISPLIVISLLPVWLTLFFLTSTVGVASSVTFGALPLAALCLYGFDSVLLCFMAAIGCWGLYRHRDNIKRYASVSVGSSS